MESDFRKCAQIVSVLPRLCEVGNSKSSDESLRWKPARKHSNMAEKTLAGSRDHSYCKQ